VGYVTVTTAAVPDPDGIVDGTTGNDLIDTAYLGDPQGDRVDNNDALGVQGTTGDGDVINGFQGNDTIRAGAGDDIVDGGAGNDVISGGAGNDTLIGGDGNDTFIYAPGDNLDTLLDFNFGNTGTLNDVDITNNDRVDLSAFYDNIWELTADFNDDCILNQSNDGLGGADYSDNASFGSGGLVVVGATGTKASFNVENTGVVCFASGTRILTETGDRRIDTLRVGDRIVTRDNGVQTLRWIGRRHLDKVALAQNRKLRPILLSASLTGGDTALTVSPQHGVLFTVEGEERLVRAVHLAGLEGGTARIMQGCRQVTYPHLMFDGHQILFANGAPSESFFPGHLALAALHQEARDEIFTLFPDLRHVQAGRAYGEPVRGFAGRQDLPAHLKGLRIRAGRTVSPSLFARGLPAPQLSLAAVQ